MLFLVLACSILRLTVGASWGYADGTASWASSYTTCAGQSQSPINIVTDNVVSTPSLGNIRFHGYDTVVSTKMKNNGHSISVELLGSDAVYIEGGGLPSRYNLLGWHIHFGGTNTEGSEHIMDGVHYPAEIHFVHMRDSYSNVQRALDSGDHHALAVVGYFITLGDTDNVNMEGVIDAALQVQYPDNDTVELSPMALQTLMPDDKSAFYRYDGSLTTPTCDEVVAWTVLKDTITLSEGQLEDLRSLYIIESSDAKTNSAADWMKGNFREIQHLNGRTVQTNEGEDEDTDPNSASITRPVAITISTAILTIFFLRRF